jgi:hypothetical protein
MLPWIGLQPVLVYEIISVIETNSDMICDLTITHITADKESSMRSIYNEVSSYNTASDVTIHYKPECIDGSLNAYTY